MYLVYVISDIKQGRQYPLQFQIYKKKKQNSSYSICIEKGHSTVNYTGTQSFRNHVILFISLKLWALIIQTSSVQTFQPLILIYSSDDLSFIVLSLEIPAKYEQTYYNIFFYDSGL